MGLTSRQFLISSCHEMHRLSESDFVRLYRGQGAYRIAVLANQRVRWACLVVELFNRQPVRVVRMSLGFLHFDATGRLDVDRLNQDQGARMEAAMAPLLARRTSDTVIDASSRFLAAGGLWTPDAELIARLQSAALGRQACPRIKPQA